MKRRAFITPIAASTQAFPGRTRLAAMFDAQPANKFELVLDLKTAKVIGVELPTAILLRADQVIECASSDLVVEAATQTAVPS